MRFGDRVVVYPASEGYDMIVEVRSEAGIKRAKAFQDVIRVLKVKAPVLHNLRTVFLGGGFGGTIYGDIVEIGGARSVIEHLVSLVHSRPSATFQIIAGKGYLNFDYDRVPLFKKIDVLVPPFVAVGAEVRGMRQFLRNMTIPQVWRMSK